MTVQQLKDNLLDAAEVNFGETDKDLRWDVDQVLHECFGNRTLLVDALVQARLTFEQGHANHGAETPHFYAKLEQLGQENDWAPRAFGWIAADMTQAHHYPIEGARADPHKNVSGGIEAAHMIHDFSDPEKVHAVTTGVLTGIDGKDRECLNFCV